MTGRAPAPREWHGPRRARGLATVEFAVTAPLLLFLILGVSEVGRAIFHYATLSHLVRDAARYVTENSIAGTTGVVEISATTIDRARNLAVYGNINGAGQPKLPAFAPEHVQVIDTGGNNIQVTANYPYQPMLGATLPNFGLSSQPTALDIILQIAVTMRAIS